jgi:ribosomal-protein-alanine N-acetyltransferase
MNLQSEVTIRPMEFDDLPQVSAIDRLSFSLPWPERAFHYELSQNPNARLWVAEVNASEEKVVVGLVVVWLIVEEAHIANIAVHPDYRNRGIGKQLLEAALKSAILSGAREAMLEVRANNQVAQEMYRQFGFEVVSRRPRYYRDNNEDALLMNLKDIGPAYLEWLERGKQGGRQ